MSKSGFQSHALCRHPEEAEILEKVRFDAVFLADVLSVYDVYKNSKDPAIINCM